MKNGSTLVITRIMTKQKNSIIPIEIIVIGTGNIAIRHIKNLQLLKPMNKIFVLKRSNRSLDKFFKKSNINIISNIEDIHPVNSKSLAIICSPASLHSKDIKVLSSKGFNIFVEKPFLTQHDRISTALNYASNNKVITSVGYNMRFTERLQYMKKQIIRGNLNDIQNVNIEVLTDFRKWRKNKDYKDTVSFNKSLGGGVINELSHEVDYMIYLFGKPKSVKVSHNKDYKIASDVELNIIADFNYNKNFTIKLHANMLSDKNKRICSIYTKENNFIINHLSNKIQTIGKNESVLKFNDSTNQSYMNEIKDMLHCITKNVKSLFSFEYFVPTQVTLNAMHSSLHKNKRIYLR